MRFALPVVLVSAVASFALLAFNSEPVCILPRSPVEQGPEVAPAPREQQPDPSRDLKLIATFEGKYAHVQTRPLVVLTLVNTSKTFTYAVLKPGAGCDIGKREPHVSFTAEQRSWKGVWEPTESLGFAGCGLYGVGAKDEVLDLKPGEKLPITGDGFHGHFQQFRYPSSVRMVGHYDYLVGQTKGPFAREPVAGMRGMQPFKLVSNPVEFEVVQPLNLQVKVKRPLKVGEKVKISDILEVMLTNATGELLALPALGEGSDSRLKINFNSRLLATDPSVNVFAGPAGAKVELKADETAPLLGPGQLANGADGWWRGREAGKFSISVEYSTPAWKDGEKIYAFAEIAVEK